MPRENAHDKARRLLSEGRVTIRALGENEIVAVVRGDSARCYTVRWDPNGWTCDCEARIRCSHARGVQLVVLEPRRR